VEWIHAVLREGKLYGMVTLIALIVWVAGYSARVDQRWHEMEWLSAPKQEGGPLMADLEPLSLDGLDVSVAGAR
jgi:hypothetical protein